MTAGEKGYVQFRYRWEQAPPPAGVEIDGLRRWRDRLHQLGLVGVHPNGIGYGNLSCRRTGSESFVITGTGTGSFPALRPEHLTEVIAFDLAANHLTCRGPVVASSEALSHAALYRSAPAVAAVVHVHHAGLWERHFGRLPTTDPVAEAGTPAMAAAIALLFEEDAVHECGVFVMGGHREGLIAFGGSVDQAGERLIALRSEHGGMDDGD